MPQHRKSHWKPTENGGLVIITNRKHFLCIILVVNCLLAGTESRPTLQQKTAPRKTSDNFPFWLSENPAELRLNYTVEARWINPCDLPGHIFEPTSDVVGAPPVSKRMVAFSIASRARVALNHATNLHETYLKQHYKDKGFVLGTVKHRMPWLPKLEREIAVEMDLYDACRTFYKTMQYFGVALEQVTLDEVMYGGALLPWCREAEDHLTQVLCQIQMGTFLLRIDLDLDVTRDVMKQEYRNVSKAQRFLRNYLIFRDYVEALDIMVETFENIYARTLTTTLIPPPDTTLPEYFNRRR